MLTESVARRQSTEQIEINDPFVPLQEEVNQVQQVASPVLKKVKPTYKIEGGKSSLIALNLRITVLTAAICGTMAKRNDTWAAIILVGIVIFQFAYLQFFVTPVKKTA